MSDRELLGAQTLPYLSAPFERAVTGIAGAGLTTIGLYPADADGPLFSDTPTGTEIDRVRAAVADAGLELVSMFSHDLECRSADRLIADLRLCAELGSRHLLTAGPWHQDQQGNPKPVMQWFGEVEHFLTQIGLAAPEAEKLGVTLTLKPHGGPTATGADLVAILERIGSPAVRGCWDAGNIRFYEGLDSEQDLAGSGVAPWISMVAVKDHRGGAGAPDFPVPGDGDVDHPQMLRLLHEAGFDGPLLVERIDQADPTDLTAVDTALAQARENLTAALAASRKDN